MDMEEPFGRDPGDMPGLSYVSAAAETTLALIIGHDDPTALPGRDQRGAIDVIATVDPANLGLVDVINEPAPTATVTMAQAPQPAAGAAVRGRHEHDARALLEAESGGTDASDAPVR